MKFITNGALALALTITLSGTAIASEDNYNPLAGDDGDGFGYENSNCNSAFHLGGCGDISTAPGPVLGGGIGALIIAGFGLYNRRRQARQNLSIT